jgi:fructose-1,6-bisphosphatase
MAKVTVEEFVSTSAGTELGAVFGVIAAASSEIAKKIRLAGLSDVYGAYGAVNVQGEQQQKLDVFANEVLIERLGALPNVAAIVSEEDDAPVEFDHPGADFVVIFDPLDGSSNIDVNVNVGTIFSIVRTTGDVTTAALQVGTEQIAAGYVVYGPSCVFVLTTGTGVSAFTLDEARTTPPTKPTRRAGRRSIAATSAASSRARSAASPTARATSAASSQTSIAPCSRAASSSIRQQSKPPTASSASSTRPVRWP